MLFCVVKPINTNDYRRVMGTDHVSCIYTEAELSEMYYAGYQFMVNDKLVKINKSDKNPGRTVWAALSEARVWTMADKNTEPAKGTSKIHCITTDEYFDKQSEAAKFYGIDPAQVSDSIKTGRPRSGYVFEKVIVDAK